MTGVTVVHLVWGPLGAGPPKAFADSYSAHRAGVEHDLVIVLNGVESAGERAELLQAFDGVEHRVLDLDQPVLDLEAYRRAAKTEAGRDLAFLGAHTSLKAQDWLQKLTAPLGSEIGLTGACGSYQSIRDTLPALERVTWRRSFPPFPNPHIRTHAFALSSETLAAIDWPEIDGKKSAWGFENGRRSLYRRVLETGRRAVVIGADGSVWDEATWPESQTFYSGEQENLLIGDLRTQAFIEADAEERARLAKLTWG